jgi:uncharacterized membrane protein
MGRNRIAQGLPLLARRFARDSSGAVAIMGAAFTLAAIGVTAVVADWGSLYLAKRDQQGVTDLAALVAARNLTNANAAAGATLASNGVTPTGLVSVTLGSYTANPALASSARFVPGGTPTNAVRVSVPSDAPLFFGRMLTGQDTMAVLTEATAASTEIAAFSIGSRLASLNNGVLNSLLGGLLGGNVSLSLMDYNALASAQVSLFPFLDSLATRAGVTAGTYTQLAGTNVSVGDVMGAMADAGVTGASASTATAALTYIGDHTNASTAQLPAGRLVDLGPYATLATGEGSGLSAKVGAMNLLSAAAVAANGTNQVAVNLGATVPGLLSLTASVTVGEPMQNSAWFRVGEDGATIYTAQTRVRLDAQVAGTGLSSTPVINLPILADIASATGRIADIDCGDNPMTDGQVTIMARPSVADLWIGTPTSGWSNFSAAPAVGPAQIVSVPLLASVSASGHVSVSNMSETPLNFTWADVQNNTIKTVSTTTPVTSLVSSLLANTTLTPTVVGFNLPIVGTTVGNTVASLLGPVGPALDPVLISILDAFGVRIGEADVALNGFRCDGSVLVN